MKHFKLILAITLVFSALQIHAQTDTTYFDINWNETKIDSAYYFRVLVPKKKVVQISDYYMNGMLQMTGTYCSSELDLRQGYFKNYSKSGKISSEGNYWNDQKHGTWLNYDSQGNLQRKTTYRRNKLHGVFIAYYLNGSIKRKHKYRNGKFKSGKCFDENGAEIPYFTYESVAEFPGGREALKTYLAANLVYPFEASDKFIQGKVIVRFVIDENGNLTSAKVVKGVHKLLDDAAISLVKGMPDWSPGMKNDFPEKSYFDLPINFTLE